VLSKEIIVALSPPHAPAGSTTATSIATDTEPSTHAHDLLG
jgi:hypothetical protein